MFRSRGFWHAHVATLVFLLSTVADVTFAEEMDCYGSGSIAGGVIGTFIVTLLLLGLAYFLYKKVWKPRREKHLVLETDPEQGDKYAFDNPCFKDAGLTPIGKALDKNASKLLDNSTGKKWSHWSPLGALVSTKNEKKRTMDDSYAEGGDIRVVSLRSHDFTGLGFNVCGNMRDGIYIKDILHRGPASESGKLNSGDRIKSVRISFEHMVYEDALTILSYASPYEVQIEAQGGFKGHNGPPGSGGSTKRQGAEPRHPMYRSSSSSDLIQIGKSARHRLFQAENLDGSITDYSTLQLSSNNTTLERGRASTGVNSLAKPERNKKPQNPSQNLSPEQLKSQLEHNLAQKIAQAPDIKYKDKKIEQEIQQTETDSQNKNRFQKFGVRVLPPEMKSDNNQPSRSPKSAELSQNDNNINLERNLENEKMAPEGRDEVDKMKSDKPATDAPPIKRREKAIKSEEFTKEPSEVTLSTFERQNSLNGSGIKRDKAGIPQEIPDHMLKAAVAARKNRKSSDATETDLEEAETTKTPKKQKGKAPAPPDISKQELKDDAQLEGLEEESKTVSTRLNFTDDFDEISTINDKDAKPAKNTEKSSTKMEEENPDLDVESNPEKMSEDGKEYCSDSDVETDNQSSVNTIELNASDITIHHAEEDGTTDIKGRKTASTGDLSKIQKAKKTGTGTLERAQSLDITDSGIPTLTKKRKAAKDDLDSKLSSDESLYEKTAKNKEPRLSLALDGLDTFQRNRLKKSSEWGNIQDVVMHLDKVENVEPSSGSKENIEFVEARSPIKFNFGTKDTKFGNSITHIGHGMERDGNDDVEVSIHSGSLSLNEEPQEADVKVRNIIWPNFEVKEDEYVAQGEEIQTIHSQVVLKKNDTNVEITQESSEVKVHNILWPGSELNRSENETQTKPELKPKFELKKYDLNSKSDMKPIQVEYSESSEATNTFHTKTEIIESRSNDIVIPTEKPATPQKPVISEGSFSLKAQFQERLNSKISQNSNDTSAESVQGKSTNHNLKPQIESSIFHPGKSSQNFIFAEKYASNNDNDGIYNFSSKLYDTNVSDDIKVSRHSLGSLERPKSDVLKSVNKLKMQGLISSNQGGVSNITVTENKSTYENGTHSNNKNISLDINTSNDSKTDVYDMSTASELYTTAIDSTIREDKPEDNIHIVKTASNAMGIQNITITETISDNKLLSDSPSSLTIDTSSDGPDSIKSNTLTFVTEIQVSPSTNGSHKNVSEITMNTEETQNESENKKPEEQLKKLPEMKFTTSSYESPKTPEKRLSHIELLRSNFERSPPKTNKVPEVVSPTKSRIPVATKLELKPSPERKELKIGEIDTEEREIVEIMSSAVHSTPIVSTSQRFVKNPPRNVTVTSIRTSSKIPSGQHTSSTFTNKPPVPARPTEHTDFQETRTVSANGGTESTFKQWVFNPSESSVTNIIVNNKEPHK